MRKRKKEEVLLGRRGKKTLKRKGRQAEASGENRLRGELRDNLVKKSGRRNIYRPSQGRKMVEIRPPSS